jgi:hypothetical protein
LSGIKSLGVVDGQALAGLRLASYDASTRAQLAESLGALQVTPTAEEIEAL